MEYNGNVLLHLDFQWEERRSVVYWRVQDVFLFLTVKAQSNPIMSQSINLYKYGADKAIRLASTLSS